LGYWQKHTDKDIERVLTELHRHGYKIENPPKYYTVKCPCGQHQRQVHCTPSGRYHGNHVLQWAKRLPCWTTEEGG
jgi:hypothetical protein